MDSLREHAALVDDLTRRGFLQRAGVLGLGALVMSAAPVARELLAAQPANAQVLLPDATLQAFADTMIPGRKADRTDLGNPIDPRAIAGVDHRPGAVESEVLSLYNHPMIGFTAVATPFLLDLESRAGRHGGSFLDLGFDERVAVCKEGLSFQNPDRVLWEAAAAVPFTAFCAAAMVPEQRMEKASGYRVMGLPGAAPEGYRDFSWRKKLAKERTRKGFLQ